MTVSAAITTATKERPIIFSSASVNAILAGNKTQTRRVVKPQPPAGFDRHAWFHAPIYGWTNESVPALNWHQVKCPLGMPGDRVWVRETFMLWDATTDEWEGDPHEGKLPVPWDEYSLSFWRRKLEYLADRRLDEQPYRSPIFMPRWASRITLEITDVRVERVTDITYGDVMAEGCPRELDRDQDWFGPANWFKEGWDRLNKKRGYGYHANPWVWCITFRRVEK